MGKGQRQQSREKIEKFKKFFFLKYSLCD